MLKRIFKIGQSEISALLDKIENPIKISEQSIKDLKVIFNKNLESLAKVKAVSIKLERQIKNQGIIITQKTDTVRTESAKITKKVLSEELEKNENYVIKVEAAIQKVQNEITKWESKLIRLKSRYESVKALKRINKEQAKIDINGILATLERAEDKISEEECLSKAYENLFDFDKNVV
jgi:phage shock protein A